MKALLTSCSIPKTLSLGFCPVSNPVQHLSTIILVFFISGSIQEGISCLLSYVSSQVINIRLSSLGYEIDQYRCGIPLESVGIGYLVINGTGVVFKALVIILFAAFSCDYTIGY